MPLFSIITPVYNKEKYVRNAIESVLNQDYEDFEYIIVDDGSTDSSPKIVDEMAQKDTRIKVIHQKNQWIYESFNNGIKAATGRYIYIVNADDCMRSGVLREAAEIIKDHKPDVIWTKVVKRRFGDKSETILQEENSFFPNVEAVRDNWIYFFKSFLSFNQANFYKRDVIEKYSFRNDVYGADLLFNISIASDITSAVVMGHPAYDFYIYDSKEMNISIGKYYEYEHRMLDEIFTKNQELFIRWGKYNKETELFLKTQRIKQVTQELKGYLAHNCELTLKEKVAHIWEQVAQSEVLFECACDEALREEFESRLFSGLKNVFMKHIEEVDALGEYYFLYEFLESILRYEKTEEDYEKIAAIVMHEKNPKQIGRIYFNKVK